MKTRKSWKITIFDQDGIVVSTLPKQAVRRPDNWAKARIEEGETYTIEEVASTALQEAPTSDIQDPSNIPDNVIPFPTDRVKEGSYDGPWEYLNLGPIDIKGHYLDRQGNLQEYDAVADFSTPTD